MNDQSSAAPGGQHGSPERRPVLISQWWQVATIVAVVMALLALLGVGLTMAQSTLAAAYWIMLVPIYGALCIATAWSRARHHGESARPAVVRQIFHWLGIGGALGLDFFVRGTGTETAEATGLNALLVLSLGCYLAGVHLERLFVLVGLLLSAILLGVAKAEQYLWLILILGALAVVAILLLGRMRRHKHP